MNLYSYRLKQELFETLSSLVADDIILKHYSKGEPFDPEESLLILPDLSAAQEIAQDPTMQEAHFMLWSELEPVLTTCAWSAYCGAEWRYLQLALETAKQPAIDTVLLGSSYAKYGLSALQIGNGCVNLGLDAQDIYYTCRLGQMVIEKNQNIRQVVLASGYYWFFSDISRADTAYARELITDTYYPILKDAHHAKSLNGSVPQAFLPQELRFLDEDKTISHYCRQIYQQRRGDSAKMVKNFEYDFTTGSWKMNNRYPNTSLGDIRAGELPWYMLPAQVKDAFAADRCRNHNKLLRHTESYEENKEILNQFVTFCNQRNIQLYILCMPQTAEYLRHLSPQFKEHYFAALDAIEGEFQFLDFHEADIFQHEDYLDQDHLGPRGAEKATTFLKELLDSSRK